MADLETILADKLARTVEALVRERMAATSDPLFGKAALPVDEVAAALSVDGATVWRRS